MCGNTTVVSQSWTIRTSQQGQHAASPRGANINGTSNSNSNNDGTLSSRQESNRGYNTTNNYHTPSSLVSSQRRRKGSDATNDSTATELATGIL
jgi:hypothetical protein